MPNIELDVDDPTSPHETLADDPSVYRFGLIFKGIRIDIKSDVSINTDRVLELGDIATDMIVDLDSDENLNPHGSIVYVPSDDIDIKYIPDTKEVIISGPAALFTRGDTLAYTAEYMAECLRTSESGLFLVHSAAVYDPLGDRSYVFLGEKGAGKTTMALRLCHEQGMSLIGNDQVYIGQGKDGLVTNGGNTWFNIRETAVMADPYLTNLVGRSRDNTKPSWNDKTTVYPSAIGVGVKRDEAKIQTLFHIRIDQEQERLHTRSWEGTQRNLFLHEKLGRHVTGQATPFQDDKGNYLGSLPSINLKQSLARRDSLVGLIISQGITEIFTPDSASAVRYIIDRAQSQQ